MNSSTKLVLLSTLLTLSVALTAASPAEMTIFPKESSARIDSFTSYEVNIENTGPVKDVYSLSSTDSSSISIAPRQVELGPSESAVVNVWYNPDTQQEAGKYSFDIKAESRATGKTYSVKGIVNVIREHDVSLSVEDTATACLGEKATYQVQVTNNGIQKETFELTSPNGEFTRKKVTLEDGETATLKLQVSSKKATEKTFNVVAASTTSYAQSIESVSFKAEVCYASDVVINPSSQRVPAKTAAQYDITIRNTGTKADTFVLQTNTGNLATSEIQIPAKSSKSTTLKVSPTELGQQTVKVTAKSAVTTTGTATMTVYNGMDMSVELPKKTVQACENTVETTTVKVTNTGEAKETYKLKASKGSLTKDEVTLGVQESKKVGLELNTSNYNLGKVNFQVTATASSFNQPKKTVQGAFNVRNCWDLEMSIIPEVASAGENMSQVYEVRLKNTGAKENTYELTYEGPSWIQIRDREGDNNQHDVTVAPGKTGYADIYAGVPFQKKGEVEITATAVGEQVKKSKTVKLVVGQEIEEAIKSDRGGSNSITGMFSKKASDLIKQVQGQGTLSRAAAAVVIGLLLTGAILYWEW
ncbi:MAG: hypothetical protein ABEK04_03490 [Candidatus Nanohalobium sp.]